jgi:hypothetical protein
MDSLDPRQFLLLAIAILVPLVLFALRKPHWVLGWVAITISVHIFDTTTITNLPAGRIVGILYLPVALRLASSWAGLRPARAWLINIGYLVLLGIIFGLIWPWPDITEMRPFTLTAPGRLIVFTGRLLADTGLIVFVAHELRRPGALLFLGRGLVAGAAITALAGLLNLLPTTGDLYFAITGLRDLYGLDRPRGLSFEPRGLGQACAYALLILLVYPGRLTLRRFALLLLTLGGLLAAYSTSAFALFVCGLVAVWIFLSNRVRLATLGMVVLGVVLLGGAAIALPDRFAGAVAVVEEHLDPTIRLRGAAAENLGEEIAYRLDSFDASALLFFYDNPLYALTGTGPGMMMLPASYYVPPGLFSLMYNPNVGLDGIPTLGLLLEVSNGGVISLVLWLVQVGSCWGALRRMKARSADEAERTNWAFGQALLLIGVTFYIVQTSITSPIWAVILGVGWAAAAADRTAIALLPAGAPAQDAAPLLPKPDPQEAAQTV